MYTLSESPFRSGWTCAAVLVCMTISSFGRPASALAGNSLPGNQQNTPPPGMSDGKMAHMYMTSLRPPKAGDQAEGGRNRGGGKSGDGALPGLPQGAG